MMTMIQYPPTRLGFPTRSQHRTLTVATVVPRQRMDVIQYLLAMADGGVLVAFPVWARFGIHWNAARYPCRYVGYKLAYEGPTSVKQYFTRHSLLVHDIHRHLFASLLI